MAAALAGVLATAHGRVADRVHRGLDRLGGRWLGSWLERNALRFQRTDEGLAAFFRHERMGLVPSIVLYELGWFVRSLETWLFLRLVGVDVPLAAAMVIETALILVRAMAVPVPAGLGVQDAGYVLCLRALAVPDATTVGAAFVLLKRGKDLFWILLGFLLLGVGRRRGDAAAPVIAESGPPGFSRPGAGRPGCRRRCPRRARSPPAPRRGRAPSPSATLPPGSAAASSSGSNCSPNRADGSAKATRAANGTWSRSGAPPKRSVTEKASSPTARSRYWCWRTIVIRSGYRAWRPGEIATPGCEVRKVR